MQNEQSPRKGRTSFTLLQKDRARLVLLKYSEQTGKKWAVVCSEIMKLVGGSATSRAPLLTRQDLEAWVSGRSQLGDEKFALVYAFLTHPKTLKREEFKGASSINIEERLSGYAKVLNDLVGGTVLTTVYADKKTSGLNTDLAPTDFDGLYVLRRDDRYDLIYLAYDNSLNIYLCHLFISPQKYTEGWVSDMEGEKRREGSKAEKADAISNFDVRSYLAKTDWSIIRYSGLAVFGNPIRVFLRGLEKKDVKEFSIYASLHGPTHIFGRENYSVPWLVDHRSSQRIAEHIARSDEANNGYVEYLLVDTSEFVLRMGSRSFQDMGDVHDMFEDIKWNIGL